MNNEKEIIAKLLAIATKQQKAIHKLAQAQGLSAPVGEDTNISYLKRAVDTAATNAGVTVPVGADVQTKGGSKEGNVTIEGGYIVSVRGMEKIDEKTKQKFMDTYMHQVQTQKPELQGKVSVLFA